MFDGIIKNMDGSVDYIRVMDSNIVAFNYSKYGVKKSNIHNIVSLMNSIFCTDNYQLIGYSNRYKVFYDLDNDLRHFYKDGIEDLELFIKYNGIDAVKYISDKTKIRVASMVIVCGVSVIIGLGSKLPYLIQNNPRYNSNYDYSLEDAVNYYHENINFNQKIDLDTALNYINSSGLDDRAKEVLSNEELLTDIFNYYDNTLLEKTIHLKLSGIKVNKYNELPDEDGYVTNGKYNILFPNVLSINSNVFDTPSYDRTLVHEFIHLLQAEGLQYSYIVEASAELMCSEYYSYYPDSYLPAIENLKLMIDIIGPEPIIKMLFSGDDDDFLDIIKSNLNDEDKKNLLLYLDAEPKKCNNPNDPIHKNIQEILCRLYKSLYNSDIKDDPDIMYELLYENNFNGIKNDYAIYLRPRNMYEEDYIIVVGDTESLVDKGLITKKEFVIGKKVVENVEEYLLFREDKDVSFNCNCKINEDGYLYGVVDSKNNNFFLFDKPLSSDEYVLNDGTPIIKEDSGDGEYISLIDAFERGYINIDAYKSFDSSTIDPSWEVFDTYSKILSNKFDFGVNDLETNDSVTRINVTRKSIKTRFPDQVERLINFYKEKSI